MQAGATKKWLGARRGKRGGAFNKGAKAAASRRCGSGRGDKRQGKRVKNWGGWEGGALGHQGRCSRRRLTTLPRTHLVRAAGRQRWGVRRLGASWALLPLVVHSSGCKNAKAGGGRGWQGVLWCRGEPLAPRPAQPMGRGVRGGMAASWQWRQRSHGWGRAWRCRAPGRERAPAWAGACWRSRCSWVRVAPGVGARITARCRSPHPSG